MKNLPRIITVSTVCLIFALFLITGCYTSPPGASIYSVPPSRPALSAQQRANLTAEDITRLIKRGDDEYDKGNFYTAKDFYYEVLVASPNPDAYVLVSYGDCLANLQYYENAIEIYNIALEKDPKNEFVMGNIALCREGIAVRTDEQRQAELEQQRQQQENINNLVASLNSLSVAVGNLNSGNRQTNTGNSNQTSSNSNSQSGTSSGKLTISGYPYSYLSTISVRALSVNPSSLEEYMRILRTHSIPGAGNMQSAGTVTWVSNITPRNGSYTIVIGRKVGHDFSYYKATGVSINNGNASVAWSSFRALN